MTNAIGALTRSAWARLAFRSAVTTCILVVPVFLWFQIQTIQAMRLEIILNRTRVLEQQQRLDSIDRTCTARLDALERVIFGDVISALEKAKPAPTKKPRVEPWQANREQAINERLDRLERWRYEFERRREDR